MSLIETKGRNTVLGRNRIRGGCLPSRPSEGRPLTLSSRIPEYYEPYIAPFGVLLRNGSVVCLCESCFVMGLLVCLVFRRSAQPNW